MTIANNTAASDVVGREGVRLVLKAWPNSFLGPNPNIYGIDLIVNPEDKVFGADAEVKYQPTAFRDSLTHFGIPPEDEVTLNPRPIETYSPDAWIIIVGRDGWFYRLRAGLAQGWYSNGFAKSRKLNTREEDPNRPGSGRTAPDASGRTQNVFTFGISLRWDGIVKSNKRWK